MEVEECGLAQLVVALPADGVGKRGNRTREQEGRQQETAVQREAGVWVGRHPRGARGEECQGLMSRGWPQRQRRSVRNHKGEGVEEREGQK